MVLVVYIFLFLRTTKASHVRLQYHVFVFGTNRKGGNRCHLENHTCRWFACNINEILSIKCMCFCNILDFGDFSCGHTKITALVLTVNRLDMDAASRVRACFSGIACARVSRTATDGLWKPLVPTKCRSVSRSSVRCLEF